MSTLTVLETELLDSVQTGSRSMPRAARFAPRSSGESCSPASGEYYVPRGPTWRENPQRGD